MADFITSLKKGVNAAKEAEFNKLEIQSVIKELNLQLARELEGKLKIELKTYYVNNCIQDTTTIANNKKRETYDAVVAINPLVSGCFEKQLSRWKMDVNGYPCLINFNSRELISDNKNTLEKNFQQLLSDAEIGEKINSLIEQPPQCNIQRDLKSNVKNITVESA